jgi:hypothetical protein
MDKYMWSQSDMMDEKMWSQSEMLDEYMWSQSTTDGFLGGSLAPMATDVVDDSVHSHSPMMPSSRALGSRTGRVQVSSSTPSRGATSIARIDQTDRASRSKSQVLLNISAVPGGEMGRHPSFDIAAVEKPLQVQRLLHEGGHGRSTRSSRKRDRSHDPPVVGNSRVESPYSSDSVYSEDSDYGSNKRSRSNSPVNVQRFVRRSGSPSLSPACDGSRKGQAPRRRSSDLQEYERWHCPYGCGKFYRTTSTRSVHAHRKTCHMRPDFKSLMSAREGLMAQLLNASSSSDPSFTGARIEALREELSTVERQLEGDHDNQSQTQGDSKNGRRKQRRRRGRGELSEREKWYCPLDRCHSFYKKTSTRSISNHLKECGASRGLTFTPKELKAKQKEGRAHGRRGPLLRETPNTGSPPHSPNLSYQLAPPSTASATHSPSPSFAYQARLQPPPVHFEQHRKEMHEKMLDLSQIDHPLPPFYVDAAAHQFQNLDLNSKPLLQPMFEATSLMYRPIVEKQTVYTYKID